jgi:hypothetical protein
MLEKKNYLQFSFISDERILFCAQVNENGLMAACILFDYECLDAKNAKALRFAGEIITDLSGIDTEVWDLMELAIYQASTLKSGI